MDVKKVRFELLGEVVKQYSALTWDERFLFEQMVAGIDRDDDVRDAAVEAGILTPEEARHAVPVLQVEPPAAHVRGTPRRSRRGRFECADCGEVFRSIRGMGVHRGHMHKEESEGTP